MENLLNIKEKIENFCEENGISLFRTVENFDLDLNNIKQLLISWNCDKENQDIDGFLQIVKKSNIPILIVSFSYVSEGSLDEKQNKLIREQGHLGELGKIVLLFVKDGICYEYENTADWYYDYIEIFNSEKTSERNEEDSNEEEHLRRCELCGNQFRVFDDEDSNRVLCYDCRKKHEKDMEERAKEIAEEIVMDSEFRACTSNEQREIFLKEKKPELFELFKGEEFPVWFLIRHANALYQIKKRKGEFLKEKKLSEVV